MAVLVTIWLLLLFTSCFIAAWCGSIQVDGINNEVVIVAQNQSLPKSLTIRRVSGIGNRVTFAVSGRTKIRPGVQCSNVNISGIDGIGNHVSISASPYGPSGSCSNVNMSSINGIDNRVRIIASPNGPSGRSSNVNVTIRDINGINNLVSIAATPHGPSGGSSNVKINGIGGIGNRIRIIASPTGPSTGCSDVNISSIDGIDNTIIIVSGASLTLEDIAATLTRYNSYLFPAESCSQISPTISGYYWIGKRSPKRIFCAFDPPQCGGEGVWRRVAKMDTTVQNAVCPGNFTLILSGSQSYCTSTTGDNCTLAQFTGPSFKEVCGVAHTHQICSHGCSSVAQQLDTRDNQLRDRLVFQYSSKYPPEQKELWTYNFATYATHNCSCSTSTGLSSDSGSYYYCTPKCWYPNYPWFRRVFQKRVSGTLELQLCLDQDNEAMAVDFAEIYIRED